MFSHLWTKYFRREKVGATHERSEAVRLTRDDRAARKDNGTTHPRTGGIEMLEGRIAPATLINPSTLAYVDADGDQVLVKFSKPIFLQTGNDLITTLNQVFKFSAGTVVTAGTDDPGTPQQLQLIDLTKIPLIGTVGNPKSPAEGVSITVTATQADTLMPKPGGEQGEVVPGTDGTQDGDGFANVGGIIASSQNNSFGLGRVTIDGDLGQIDAGGSKSPIGIVSLKVHSFGAVSGTQPTGSANAESKITGSLGSLTVETDVKLAHINVVSAGGTSKAIGKIGSINIGGTMEGSTAENIGTIQSATSIGKVVIGSGQLDDGIKGGAAKNSGAIIAGTTIGSVVINGDLKGGTGENSGSIKAPVIGTVVIGTGAPGHGILGGAGKNSGTIQATSKLTSVEIKGDLLGGAVLNSGFAAEGSGSIFSNGTITRVVITGKIDTADAQTENGPIIGGLNSARIFAGLEIGNVRVMGNLEGGAGEGSGTIECNGKIGTVNIGGDLVGSTGSKSGGIIANAKLSSVIIGGDVLGGTGDTSGFIQGNSQIGLVKISGDLKGHTETTLKNSGVILGGGSITNISIAGSLIGGKGDSSGSIQAAQKGAGILKKVTVGGQLVGGDGFSSATIRSADKLGTVFVNGSGTEAALVGGKGKFSASIYSASTITLVKVTGDVTGGDGDQSATIQSNGLLANLTIIGDLKGGKGNNSGSVISHDVWEKNIAGDLGKINVTGALNAGAGAQSGRISADGNLKSVTLGSIDVGTFETGTPGTGSCSIVTGLGAVHRGDVGTINVMGSMNGRGGDHTLLEIHGSLAALSTRGDIVDGDIHIAGNLGKLTVGVLGKRGVTANVDNVTVTAGGIKPTSAKLATAIASITVNGNVSDSQFLAGHNLAGQGTNADAQIGSVLVTGNWVASDLVAGIKAGNGEFGDGDDALIDGGSDNITSRIANVIIGGTVSGTADPTSDHFGFVAEQIGRFKVGNQLIIPNTPTSALPDDVSVRTITAP